MRHADRGMCAESLTQLYQAAGEHAFAGRGVQVEHRSPASTSGRDVPLCFTTRREYLGHKRDDTTRHDTTRHDTTRHDTTRHDTASACATVTQGQGERATHETAGSITKESALSSLHKFIFFFRKGPCARSFAINMQADRFALLHLLLLLPLALATTTTLTIPSILTITTIITIPAISTPIPTPLPTVIISPPHLSVIPTSLLIDPAPAPSVSSLSSPDASGIGAGEAGLTMASVNGGRQTTLASAPPASTGRSAGVRRRVGWGLLAAAGVGAAGMAV
ncbi:hypothetical protein FN846DRAFT_975898 [Sphaerosporella brunnea]|uniref:Uncharacterized protein n=1 Tax=Sphaerosporella brunnea TaxID=1250544 RepID=A0A5J5EGN4_9PEZI|nr:hypothetical protein FN846DRAFT_975898 [Sphaerosporella brunnea]